MKDFLHTIRLVALALIIITLADITHVAAWTAAPSSPPSGNVAGPLTTGGPQQKDGGLSLNMNGTYSTGLLVGGAVGIDVASPIRALTVGGGEISIVRQSNSTAFLNVSDTLGNSGGNLQIRGLGSGGSAGVNLGNLYLAANTTQLAGNLQFPDGTVQTTAANTIVYDSNGPYTNCAAGNCPFTRGDNNRCTCRTGLTTSSTCTYNSFMSGGNNYGDCVYTATLVPVGHI